MTKEEILAMKAGRQLDGLVAKEIMGIKVEYPFAEGYPYYLKEGKDRKMEYDTVALYSTDISAAWQVVARLHEEGYAPILTWLADGYTCVFSKGPTSWEGIARVSAPEAICKAALIAKYSTKKES